MTHDTITAVIGVAQGHYLLDEELLRDIWLDGQTLLRLSQLSDIPIDRLVSGPITQDEFETLPSWGEALADEVISQELLIAAVPPEGGVASLIDDMSRVPSPQKGQSR